MAMLADIQTRLKPEKNKKKANYTVLKQLHSLKGSTWSLKSSQKIVRKGQKLADFDGHNFH